LNNLIKDMAIIGTGFGGLGMAINLKQAGHDDFVILGKAQFLAAAGVRTLTLARHVIFRRYYTHSMLSLKQTEVGRLHLSRFEGR
jgi:cation diffusion facilitator CzcD-associated flavoprotein CzcO